MIDCPFFSLGSVSSGDNFADNRAQMRRAAVFCYETIAYLWPHVARGRERIEGAEWPDYADFFSHGLSLVDEVLIAESPL
jgi:hypothetical protein